MDGVGEHVAGVAGDDEVSRDPAMVSAPLVSTLGHAVARQRLRAMLLGEADEPVRVDRFALRRELGQGGMGTVWLAHDAQLDREVALKFLRRSADGEEAEQRLLAEAKSLAKLSHPHVVPVYDAGRHEGRVWVAMEFVPGRTLRAWVETERPSPRQRLEAWLEAGRGLAAVHAAGLVHRDVKPDNVLRGDDGRVRIIDFGLVRRAPERGGAGEEALRTLAAGDSTGAAAPSPTDADRLGHSGPTRTGQFVGTPAYAAPEQISGERVDARADQFSFCVSVWETLCGRRPDKGQLPERAGALVPLPAGARMPGRVRRALSRGLCLEPGLRFPSMDALLGALAPRRGRWVAAAVAGTGALGVTLGLLAAPSEAVAEPCANAGRAIDARWTDDRKRAAHDGLGPTAGPIAVEALDDFAVRWRESARRSCEEVEVEQVRSPRSLDVRRECLEAQLDELDALVDAFGRGESRAARSVGRWLAALDEPESCLVPALLDGHEGPTDPQQRRALGQLRQALFEVRLGMRDPGLDGRQQRARQLRERARALGHRTTEAHVAEVQGELAYLAGDATSARRSYGDALDLGTTLHEASLVAEAWYGLGMVALSLDVDLGEAAWLLDRQDRAVAALDGAVRPVARSLVQRGRWHLLRDERVEAESAIRRAIAMLHDAGPSAQWAEASALRNLANVMIADGRSDEALTLHDQARALELYQAEPDPTMVKAVHGDVLLAEGITQMSGGRLDDAVATLDRALQTLRLERGPRSAHVANAHATLAAALDAKGDVERARAHALQADEILRESHGVGHPDRVHALSALGTLEFRMERFFEAVVAYERALELAALQPDALASTLAVHRANLGEALARAGDLRRAKGLLERAVLDLEASVGPDDPQVAVPNKALGEVLLARGDVTAARHHLERAAAVLEAHGISEVELAETRWALARALLADGEREAARQLATRAAAEFSALGPSWIARTKTIETWIQTNREQ